MATHVHSTPKRRPEPAASGSGRRSLFGAITALACTPVLGASAVPAPDAGLIRLAKLAAETEAEYRSITDRGGPEASEDKARINVLVDQGHELTEAAADMTATTLEGMKAKARILLIYAITTPDGLHDWTTHDGLLGWSIAHDLLELDGAA